MPENHDSQAIIRLDLIQLEYSKRRLCQCEPPHYEVDMQNRLVYCRDCGAVIDPFEALVQVARRHERINAAHAAMMAQREAVAGYSPKRKVIKELEAQYSRRNPVMLPTCPVCRQPFHLEALLGAPWVNERYATAAREEKEG